MPISPNSSDLLSWESMTAAINEIKSPNSFVRNLLFSRDDPKETKTIELSYWRRGRMIAPFVKRGAAAIQIPGHTEEFVVVEPPHIRIKRPMEPTTLFNQRRPGTRIFVDADEQRRAIEDYMAREMLHLSNDIDESLELLCASVLTGSFTYTNDEDVSFTITVPRSPSHSYDLAATMHWDEASPMIPKDFLDAMRLINTDVSLNPTHCILGKEASVQFMKNAGVQTLLKNNFGPGGIITGNLEFVRQMQESGAIFLGSPFHNIQVWEYGRQTNVNGVLTDLIRPKYAEFVTALPAAENVAYYGSIEDFDAFGEGGALARPRFSKSWVEKDPSVRIALAESNPLPVLRRPDSTVSVKVVSG